MLDTLLTWAEIDLDAIAFNVRAFRRHVGDNVEIFAVVKANGYGHGTIAVGRAALDAGAARLAVHRTLEAVQLRRAAIEAPILIMGYTPAADAETVVTWRLTPALTTLEFARALSAKAVAAGVTVPVHLQIDTGMNRFGLYPSEVIPFIEAVRALPGILLDGIFTHMATADWQDQTHARQQLAVFQDVLTACHQIGVDFPLVHAANSAAAMSLPESHFNAIRPGIALYGLNPSDQWQPVFDIKPALTLKSRVCRLSQLPAGAAISYSRTFITQKPQTTVALVPAGYGDGYHRILSNQGSVLIHGQRAAILGRVCMDQIVVDVSHIHDVKIEDEVVLIGRQGQAWIPAEEIAQKAQTINYEVTTALLPRVVRLYRQGGEIVSIDSL